MSSKSLQQEISELQEAFANVHARISEITHHSQVAEIVKLQEKIDLLTRQNEEHMRNIKWFSVRNQHLRETILIQEAHAKEQDRKLRHCRKVIRDLVEDIEGLQNMLPPGVINASRFERFQPVIDEALSNDQFYDASEDSPPTGGSDITARPRRLNSEEPTQGVTSSATVAVDPRFHASSSTAGITSENIDSPQRAPPQNSVGNSSSSTTDILVHPLHHPLEEPADDEDGVLQIHSNPPGSSINFPPVPVSWVELPRYLDLTEDEVHSLESFMYMSDLGMRLQLNHRQGAQGVAVAFIYDPIFVESRRGSATATYLIDWGFPEFNRRTKDAILQTGEQTIIHTFTYPVKRKSWFYVGAHTWKLTNISDVWPTMEDESKKKMIDKLDRRTKSAFGNAWLASLLENGELAQFCIQISSVPETVSQRFSHEMRYRDQLVQAQTSSSHSG